jgi:small subunit ribosomal protein S6
MNYDGLFILNISGKDEGLQEALDAIEKEIKAQGGKVTGMQKMDKRKFERVAGALDSGFYVNIQFSLDAQKLAVLRKVLTLNSLVFRQFYLRHEVEATPAKA